MKKYLTACLSAVLTLHSAVPLFANDVQDRIDALNRVQQAQANNAAIENIQNFQRTKQAIDNIENLKRMNSTLGHEAYQKAMAAREKGDLAEAEKQLQKAIEYDSKAEYHFELANIYALYFDKFQDIKTNASTDTMLSQARRQLELAVMQDPSMIPARYNLGVVYKRQGQFEKAREEFRKVLEQDPNQVGAKVQIGAVYEAQGFYDDAEVAYKEAADMDPYNPETKSIIQDLNRHREADRLRRKAADYPRGPMGSNFGSSAFSYAPGSHAGDLANQPGGGSTGGLLAQAAPLAGSWLLQEFMKRRSNRTQNE